jgi:hypothetical protein
MREFALGFPVYVLVEQATADPETGRYRVQGVMSIESADQRAVAVFSDRTLAVRYARDRGRPDAQVGEFDDPIDFGYFLQEQQKVGFTHVGVDPLGMLPPLIPIGEVLSSIASSEGPAGTPHSR